MDGRARRRLALVAAVCIPFGLACGVIYAIYFSGQPGQDYMVYYAAARAYIEGNPSLTFDGERFTAHMNAAYAAWLARPLSFHPWLYPPPFLLILIPFALLPWGLSYAVFIAATFACLLAAVWAALRRPGDRWLHTLSLVFAPASLFNIGTGQNAFLTAALMLGGFGLIEKRPRLAGALLGVLTYKPQFWLLTPLALIAARQWQPLASAFVTASVVALLTVILFGIAPWRFWVEWMANAPPEAYQNWVVWGRMHGESVWTNLVLLGASPGLANLGQAAAVAVAAGCVWWSYRRELPWDLQLTVLLAATMLAAPHVVTYDAVILVIAATLLFAHGLHHGWRPGEIVVPVAVWMAQMFTPPDAFRIGLITPVLTCLLIALAIGRALAVTDPRRGAATATMPRPA